MLLSAESSEMTFTVDGPQALRFFCLFSSSFNHSRRDPGQKEENLYKFLFSHFFVMPQNECENKNLS